MKTKTLFTALLLLTMFAHAQLPQGSLLTGGNLSYNYTSFDVNASTEKQSTAIINPEAFYTLNDHWGIGGGLSFQIMSAKYSSPDSKNTTTTFEIEPGVRYYGNISKTVTCYGEGYLNGSYGSSKNTSNGAESKTNITSIGLGLRPGIMWNIKERVFLNFEYGSLRFFHANYKPEGVSPTTKENSLNFNLSTESLLIGLGYTFGGKIQN